MTRICPTESQDGGQGQLRVHGGQRRRQPGLEGGDAGRRVPALDQGAAPANAAGLRLRGQARLQDRGLPAAVHLLEEGQRVRGHHLARQLPDLALCLPGRHHHLYPHSKAVTRSLLKQRH